MTRFSTLPSHGAQVVDIAARLLEELEASLHQFEKELYVVSTAISEWPAGRDGGGEAEALRWHLNDTARRLQAAADSCHASRRWSARLLART
jgi:hypothetical protein